jgi:pimeloyl-ACP methyl ester carboxylesterase
MTHAAGHEFARIEWRGHPIRIEHRWIHRERQLLMVFLHEGLGSQAMWKDFPDSLCDRLGCAGLVYSRPGYGRSTPRAPEEIWDPDFMHRQALEVLPALLGALEIDTEKQRPWLFGHSDGGSIALLHAAHFPQRVAGLVVLAPHIVVEDVSVQSIEQTRQTYLGSEDLRLRLSRWHDDVESAFWGWNRIWLDPRFRDWSIEEEIATIVSPVLAVQGVDDEYGTMAQIDGIARRVPQAELLKLPDCGHSPHRDQPEALADGVQDFFARHHQQASSGDTR